MSCKIVVPSHKRADRVATKAIVPDAIICVAESQKEDYQLHNPENEIVTHPDDVIGLIPKRNWMLKHFGDLFMIADDVNGMIRFYANRGETQRIKDTGVIRKRIDELYYLAKHLQVPVFGFAKQNSIVAFTENQWFSLSRSITGCGYGVLSGYDLYWNEEMTVKEDFWISCLCKYKYRKVLTDNRFYLFQKDTMKNAGGLSEFRNMEVEKKDILTLKSYFGDVVKKKTRASREFQNNIQVKVCKCEMQAHERE